MPIQTRCTDDFVAGGGHANVHNASISNRWHAQCLFQLINSFVRHVVAQQEGRSDVLALPLAEIG
jgi:hypothetical protein